MENGDVRFLLKQSSVYGIAQMAGSRSWKMAVLWALSLAVGIGGSGYHINRFLSLYLQHPVMVNLQVNPSMEQDFPAVTVCNLNLVRAYYERCFQVEDIQNMMQCQSILFGFGRDPLVVSDRRYNSPCFKVRGGWDTANDTTWKTLVIFEKLNEELRRGYGHQLEDLVQQCAFNGRECGVDNFSHYASLRYGNCYTFHPPNPALPTSPMAPAFDGLQLTLDLERQQLHTTNVEGVRVVVHHPTEIPNPEAKGVTISPGFETSIALKRTLVRRLPAPYRDRCVEYGSGDQAGQSDQYDCMKQCVQRRSFAMCGCTDPTLPDIPGLGRCSMESMAKMCCLDEALDALAADPRACDCPLPCASLHYKEVLSLGRLPSGQQRWDDFSPPQMRNTSARLRVHFSHLSLQYEQVGRIEASELLSNMGGEFGLWMGLSLLAFVELAETFILLVQARVPLRIGSK